MRVIICSFTTLMLLIGFAPAQSTKQAGKKPGGERPPIQITAVAGLAELPHDAAVKLRVVTGSQMLATQIRQLAPAAAQGPPAPPCAADASVTFFDAKITTPITICSPVSVSGSLDNALFFRGARPARSTLTDRGIFQSLAELKTSTLSLPYVCVTSNGPWSARIISERRCIGSCRPYNHLFVVGVPNSVEFGWYGSLNQHPAGFEFVGTPTRTDHQSFGQCNGGPGGGTQ